MRVKYLYTTHNNLQCFSLIFFSKIITLTLIVSLEIPVDVRHPPPINNKSRDLLHRLTPLRRRREILLLFFCSSTIRSNSSSKQFAIVRGGIQSVVARARPCNDVVISREAAVTAVVRQCFI